MIIIKNEHLVPFDCDGTLIVENTEDNDHLEFVSVKDPVTGGYIGMRAHGPNIRLLKEEHHRGSHIIVWSRGGYEWASNVIRALKLESYVNEVYTKPHVYFDDLDIKEWLTQRVYLPTNSRYKK